MKEPLGRCVYCLAVLAFAAPLVQTVRIQNSQDDRSLEDYAELLDVIFPRDLDGTRYAFALRLEPSFDSESQLVVRVERDGVNAEILTIAGRSAWDTLSDRRARDRVLSIDELANTIKVERHPVDVDRDTVNRWQASFFDAVSASLQEMEQQTRAYERTGVEPITVIADGVGYRIWYSQGGVESHWRFIDRERASRPNSPLGRWMAEVMELAEQPLQRVPKR